MSPNIYDIGILVQDGQQITAVLRTALGGVIVYRKMRVNKGGYPLIPGAVLSVDLGKRHIQGCDLVRVHPILVSGCRAGVCFIDLLGMCASKGYDIIQRLLTVIRIDAASNQSVVVIADRLFKDLFSGQAACRRCFEFVVSHDGNDGGILPRPGMDTVYALVIRVGVLCYIGAFLQVIADTGIQTGSFLSVGQIGENASRFAGCFVIEEEIVFHVMDVSKKEDLPAKGDLHIFPVPIRPVNKPL